MEKKATSGPLRRVVVLIAFTLLAAGCAPKSSSGLATKPSGEVRSVEVEQLSSGNRGLEQRRVILASSAAELSKATGIEVPDSGNGTYLAAFWGEKPTGGYSVDVRSARLSKGRVTVRLGLKEPPPDAFVTQALTYPYTVAFLRGVDTDQTKFAITGDDGGKLDWPISRASARE